MHSIGLWGNSVTHTYAADVLGLLFLSPGPWAMCACSWTQTLLWHWCSYSQLPLIVWFGDTFVIKILNNIIHPLNALFILLCFDWCMCMLYTWVHIVCTQAATIQGVRVIVCSVGPWSPRNPSVILELSAFNIRVQSNTERWSPQDKYRTRLKDVI